MRTIPFALLVCVFSGWLASCGLNPKGELPSASGEDSPVFEPGESENETFGMNEPEPFAEATSPDDGETVVVAEPEVVAGPEPSDGDSNETAVDSPTFGDPEPLPGAGGAGSSAGGSGGSGGSLEDGGTAGTAPLVVEPDGGAGAPPDGGVGGAPPDGGTNTPVFDGGALLTR